MTPIALIEALATLLWSYAALTALVWALHLRREDQGAHVPAMTELLSHLVPAMIILVVVVLVGALIGLPSVVAFIALLFPAGLAYGFHMALTDLRDTPTGRQDLPRLALSLGLAAVVITFRQLT
ncbi:hypothetical protein [Gymnodinialimonas ceratoperidinii]|uniref:Uncharacterized protein n=1 Tax=Gymnodinialimonas ceratoperidinii TaxID=2856823 RepID=A0A8F6TUB2_9RHOB|nr:hypothetical protein [Gymnodinialimonas ceratoperidinii]QXT38820.1 hypothetical protein KYE46_12870 [Gymnodinialimonas ceratoperidinii]